MIECLSYINLYWDFLKEYNIKENTQYHFLKELFSLHCIISEYPSLYAFKYNLGFGEVINYMRNKYIHVLFLKDNNIIKIMLFSDNYHFHLIFNSIEIEEKTKIYKFLVTRMRSQDLLGRIIHYLNKIIDDSSEIIITGKENGGCYAEYLTYILSNIYTNLIDLYTFDSYKIGNSQFVKKLSQRRNLKYIKYEKYMLPKFGYSRFIEYY